MSPLDPVLSRSCSPPGGAVGCAAGTGSRRTTRSRSFAWRATRSGARAAGGSPASTTGRLTSGWSTEMHERWREVVFTCLGVLVVAVAVTLIGYMLMAGVLQ